METGRWVVKIARPSGPGSKISTLRAVASFDSWINAAAYAEAIGENTLALMDDTHNCIGGDFDWDRWYDRARSTDIPDEVALLGRAVYRAAYQNVWGIDRMRECGWADEGEEMLRLAQKNPVEAKAMGATPQTLSAATPTLRHLKCPDDVNTGISLPRFRFPLIDAPTALAAIWG